MQKLLYFTAILFLFSCGGETVNEKPHEQIDTTESAESYVVVYDFHMKHRCKTCIYIEKTTRKVLKESFPEALENKKISLEVVAAEDPENEALVEAFGAYGTTLAISVVKNGKKEISDITTWAFKRSGGDLFEPELIEKIQDALGKL